MMRGLEAFVIPFLLNALWQVPLLFGTALVMARLLRSQGSKAIHRVWVAALWFQVVLPAVSAEALPLRRVLSALLWRQQTGSSAGVTVLMGPASAVQPLSVSATLLSAVTVTYGVCVVGLLLRFVWNYRTTVRLARGKAVQPVPSKAAEIWAWSSRCFGVRYAALVVSSRVAVPFTVGLFRPLVLVPPGLMHELSTDELRTLFAHECAHVQRRDFGWNLLYELLALPLAWHPCLPLTRTRLVESREWVCDAMAAEAVSARAVYARSLLRLATRLLQAQPTHAPHAIGMLDANALERRLMHLTQGSTTPGFLRRSANLAACLTLALTTCASAWAFRTGVLLPAPMAAPADAAARIPSGVMAGNKLGGDQPVYPPEAKAAKVQGAVVLQATISKEGKIEHLSVMSGPAELAGSAIDAVKTWSYKPYVLNGEPVDVETTITVNYNLNP